MLVCLRTYVRMYINLVNFLTLPLQWFTIILISQVVKTMKPIFNVRTYVYNICQLQYSNTKYN